MGYARSTKETGASFGRRAGEFRLQFPVLVLVAVALLILSRLDHSLLRSARWAITETVAPALSMAMRPFEPIRDFGRFLASQVELHDEVTRLRQEKRKLSGWEWRARELERRLADLQRLSNAVQEPSIDFLTARVIGDASGAFAQSIIVGVGSGAAIRAGYPVINGDGVVGRVVETGPSAARVLLVTDASSRIPVIVGEKAVRAILEGDNGSAARLRLLDKAANLAPGDTVSTSGVGGLFPKGLKIGTLRDAGQPFAVDVSARLYDLDYVSVLLFASPTLDAVSQVDGETPRDADRSRPRKSSALQRQRHD